MASARGVVLGTGPATADDLLRVAAGERIRLGAAARARMQVARSVLLDAVERGDAVYGTTRRLGAGAADAVADQAAFQVQVIRNHAGGIGAPLEPEIVRAAIAARIAHLALGGSGARPELADALAALLDRDVIPAVPDRGSVGMADLALLAAVGAVLLGEGAVLTAEGGTVPGADALSAAGLEPIRLEAHEALSLIDTNAFTIGAAALLLPRLEQLTAAADLMAALSIEAAAAWRPSGDLGPYSQAVHAGWEPAGRWRSAAMIRQALGGSYLHDDRERRVHDELCFRCAPQVHGAFDDAAQSLGAAVDDELVAPPENPLVDVGSRSVVANGNFASPGLTLALESARLAAAHVGQASERRTAVLSALARPLRAESRAGIPGLLAYTAAEGLVVLRGLAQPVSLASPVLSEVEDYATWSWTAVRQAHAAADELGDLLAIEALHAASLLRGAAAPPRLGTGTAPMQAALAAVLDRGAPTADGLVEAALDALLDG